MFSQQSTRRPITVDKTPEEIFLNGLDEDAQLIGDNIMWPQGDGGDPSLRNNNRGSRQFKETVASEDENDDYKRRGTRSGGRAGDANAAYYSTTQLREITNLIRESETGGGGGGAALFLPQVSRPQHHQQQQQEPQRKGEMIYLPNGVKAMCTDKLMPFSSTLCETDYQTDSPYVVRNGYIDRRSELKKENSRIPRSIPEIAQLVSTTVHRIHFRFLRSGLRGIFAVREQRRKRENVKYSEVGQKILEETFDTSRPISSSASNPDLIAGKSDGGKNDGGEGRETGDDRGSQLSCTEWLFYQTAGLLGNMFNHMDVVFEGLQCVPSDGPDSIITSTIKSQGPTLISGEPHTNGWGSIYTDEWVLEVDSDTAIAAFAALQHFIQDWNSDASYPYWACMAVPFMDTRLFKAIMDPANIISCSRMAMIVLCTLRFCLKGPELRKKMSEWYNVTPDDVFAFLEMLSRKHEHDAKIKSRGASSYHDMTGIRMGSRPDFLAQPPRPSTHMTGIAKTEITAETSRAPGQPPLLSNYSIQSRKNVGSDRSSLVDGKIEWSTNTYDKKVSFLINNTSNESHLPFQSSGDNNIAGSGSLFPNTPPPSTQSTPFGYYHPQSSDTDGYGESSGASSSECYITDSDLTPSGKGLNRDVEWLLRSRVISTTETASITRGDKNTNAIRTGIEEREEISSDCRIKIASEHPFSMPEVRTVLHNTRSACFLNKKDDCFTFPSEFYSISGSVRRISYNYADEEYD
jgi:hypothetical protein